MHKRLIKDDGLQTESCKKSRLIDEGPKFRVSSKEELDINILRYQNKKLGERLEVKLKTESDLRNRIEQLEKKHSSVESIVYVINRYWNQFNEDLRITLLRFDSETSDEQEKKNESESTRNFIFQLTNWDDEELEENLRQRVEGSTRAVGKILQAFDRIVQRNQKIINALNECEFKNQLNEAVKNAIVELEAENKNFNALVTSLHEKNRSLSLKLSQMKDKALAYEELNDDLKSRIDDLEYDLNRTRSKEIRLQENLIEAREKLKNVDSKSNGVNETNVSITKIEDIQKELEETRELANNRLIELEALNNQYKDTLKHVKKLEMDLNCLPANVIFETVEYKCLHSQFSVLYNESMQLRTQLEETRNMVSSAKTAHLRQIEHMESEELSMQKRLRTEVIQLEDQLAQVRKEYDMLRLEFEKSIAANEQNGPINKEMRNLITSLQSHNNQLKGEIQRYKRKLKDANAEIEKYTIEKANNSAVIKQEVKQEIKQEIKQEVKQEIKQENKVICKQEIKQEESSSNPEPCKDNVNLIKKENNNLKIIAKQENLIRELKNQLKKVTDQYKEAKIVSEMLKQAPKDLREKAHIMANEKKYKFECEELRKQLAKMQDEFKKDRKRSFDDDASKEISKLRDETEQLQKKLSLQMQEDEVLLKEMELTGSAYEDMQEMNSRLTQQLKEKDDANFKLMSERSKSQQIQKLLKEEKESLTEQILSLQSHIEAQNQVVRKLEEKERLLQNHLSTTEKELGIRQKALEQNKRNAIEAAQSAADLKLHLDKYLSQLKEAQSLVAEKSSVHQQEAFKTKRLNEEVTYWKRKYERAKKFELASTADEVLLEEIREYKEQLTCPSCKVNRKDAVLTKCFHVFCFDCLKTRYDSRQRKCPKCNGPIGANDFHRLYLA